MMRSDDALQAPPLVRGYVKGLGHEERLRMMHGELYRGVQAFHDPNRYKELLRFISSQPKRSPNNQLLIWLQHPSTTIALGPKDWQKKHGQRVRQDAWQDPIWIFAPVTAWRTVTNLKTGEEERRRVIVNVKPVTVYAQDQVEGPPLPAFTPTRLSGQAPAELWDGLTAFLEEKGYSVTRERPHTPGADGETDPKVKAVRIEPTHPPHHQLVTLGHESAHVDLDHVADMKQYVTHRGPFEIEAESAAFIFFAAHGIDSGASSFEYVDGWCRGDLDLILKTAGRSIESAQRMIESLSAGVELAPVGIGVEA
jgi:hypothetical protein